MLSPKLKADIRKLWDRFWSGGIANPLTAIEQITYLVFLRQLEDLDSKRTQAMIASSKKEKSVFDVPDGNLYRWSYIKQLSGEECLKHVRGSVFNWMKQIEGAEERMRDAVFVIPSANLLRSAIEIIDDLFVTSRNQDTLGDIYEYLLSEIAEAGKNGQFRTPRHLIRAMCDLVDPRPNESICDPACGTAGFLINAYQHILESNTSSDILEFEANGTPINAHGDELDPEVHDALRSNHFYGYDFDRTMMRLGWMNMILHGMKNPQIDYSDTLGSHFNSRLIDNGGKVGNFDVVLANPPFTGNIDQTDIGQSLRGLGTTKTELLFLELILQLLRPGGRAAVIVPEGVLFTNSQAYRELRRKLVRENQLNAIISLPDGVFNPYTNVKTSILVFAKGGHTENIWFYEVGADGYRLNAKRAEQPEKNDLWDMTVKYRLRHTAAFAGAFSRPAPAFIDGETWRQSVSLNAKSLSMAYFQPLFVLDLRNYESGDSIYPSTIEGAIEWDRILHAAHQQIVHEVQRQMEAIADEKLLTYLLKEAGRLILDQQQNVLWPEPQMEIQAKLVEAATQEVRKSLEQQVPTIRRSFEKAAEGILKTDTDEKQGFEAMLLAVAEGLTEINSLLERVPAKIRDFYNTGTSSSTHQMQKQEGTQPELAEMLRPFARLDGYSRTMFGKLLLMTESWRDKIKSTASDLQVPFPSFPELPKDWETPLPIVEKNGMNFGAKRYKPLVLRTLDLDPPEKIMAEWQELHRQIQKNYDLLQSMIRGEG